MNTHHVRRTTPQAQSRPGETRAVAITSVSGMGRAPQDSPGMGGKPQYPPGIYAQRHYGETRQNTRRLTPDAVFLLACLGERWTLWLLGVIPDLDDLYRALDKVAILPDDKQEAQLHRLAAKLIEWTTSNEEGLPA